MRDIREVVDIWYIVIEGKGYKIGEWDETLLEAEVRVKDNPGKQVVVMSEKEWNNYYTKRGKNSKKVNNKQ